MKRAFSLLMLMVGLLNPGLVFSYYENVHFYPVGSTFHAYGYPTDGSGYRFFGDFSPNNVLDPKLNDLNSRFSTLSSDHSTTSSKLSRLESELSVTKTSISQQLNNHESSISSLSTKANDHAKMINSILIDIKLLGSEGATKPEVAKIQNETNNKFINTKSEINTINDKLSNNYDTKIQLLGQNLITSNTKLEKASVVIEQLTSKLSKLENAVNNCPVQSMNKKEDTKDEVVSKFLELQSLLKNWQTGNLQLGETCVHQLVVTIGCIVANHSRFLDEQQTIDALDTVDRYLYYRLTKETCSRKF